MNTLSDAILRLNFTAREGGAPLRRAANAYAKHYLPGDGWCFFDVRHEFPDAWQLLMDGSKGEGHSRSLKLRLERRMFPFIPGAGDLWINKIAILFDADLEADDDCGCPEIEGCPCPRRGEPARQVIEFSRERDEDDEPKEGYKHDERGERGDDRDHEEHYKRGDIYEHKEDSKHKENNEHKKDYDREDDDCELSVSCVVSEAWPDLYYGMFDTRVGPLRRGRHHTIEFRLPARVAEVKRVFLLLRYTLEKRCDRFQ
jgi:hypothetical protein